MQGPMEKKIPILLQYDRCSELKFCTKVKDGEIVNHLLLHVFPDVFDIGGHKASEGAIMVPKRCYGVRRVLYAPYIVASFWHPYF
jgi:hypothetical protein